jgi:Xaa-Pro dipeptidase
MSNVYQERFAQLQNALRVSPFEHLLILPGPNLTYLTGVQLNLSERPAFVVVSRAKALSWLLPLLEEAQLAHCALPCGAVYTYSDQTGPAAACEAFGQHLEWTGQPVGIETRRLRFLELQLLNQAHGPDCQPADALFAQLRQYKSAAEITLIRHITRLAEAAWMQTLPMLKVGATEQTIAQALCSQLYLHGASGLGFAPIIASGSNGANPHAGASARPLQAGDLVTVDWGMQHEAYHTDITRTYAIASAPVPLLQQAYTAVQAANAAARAAVKPGVTAAAIDDAARSVIDAAGFGPFFTHRTGHGLGLEVHEEPDIKTGNIQPLHVGQLFTIEPGIYLPQIGGVRIEDIVVITETGHECLTVLPRDLQII